VRQYDIHADCRGANTCRSRISCGDGRNDGHRAAGWSNLDNVMELGPPRGRSVHGAAATRCPQNAGKLCTDRKDETGDNGVGKSSSATLVGGPFILGHKLARLGRAKRIGGCFRWRRVAAEMVNPHACF
jgi:hypothetical protein